MSGKSSIKEYRSIVAELKEKIRSARSQAVFTVNRQLLTLYWEIGHTISQQEKSEGWGAKVVETLSKDLSTEFPDLKGLSCKRLLQNYPMAPLNRLNLQFCNHPLQN